MLKTREIVLAPILQEDSSKLMGWINQRDLVHFNAAYKPVHEEQHQQWFESLLGRKDLVIFGIKLVDDGTLIGTCQLHSIHLVHRSAELQIRIGEADNHGKGFGTQAVSLLLQFAFDDLNLNRVYLHVFASNKAAIRVYEKVGFQQEGILRQAAFINGEYTDVVVMGILQENYSNP